ncbi:MAG TPA: lipopolysaccharide heptosyltransferase I [Gammaproteobacteria bacterium]|jgi:heptosyltransferase I|nr:lipopolysaccharide heptosyltransferase I [Pseudomonadota bacterium]HAY44967.1 lipopolysaccharide heptosyltransferase I [Gammaproteobacteria bacterium]
MKRVLIIKMSSMGDVLHALPAITEAVQHLPELQFDWVVEKGFEQIPSWHPSVDKVVVASTRAWRKNWWSSRAERKAFVDDLTSRKYDLVIDAQGLMKSAWIAHLAEGPVSGFSFLSVREQLAAFLYKKRYNVPSGHAVKRLRALLSLSLDYTLGDQTNDYGIDLDGANFECVEPAPKTLLFLHGTTWASKHWPESNWIDLTELAGKSGYTVWLPWWSEEEHQRCLRIAASNDAAIVLPRGDLNSMRNHISAVDAVVAVDTGLGHMAAALSVPCLSIYGATDSTRTGTWGMNQQHLRARYNCSPCLARECNLLSETVLRPPCYESCSVDDVWRVLSKMLCLKH